MKPSKHFVNGLLGFITLGIYTRWKRVCIAHNIVKELPIDMGNFIAPFINILLGSFQLFLQVIAF